MVSELAALFPKECAIPHGIIVLEIPPPSKKRRPLAANVVVQVGHRGQLIGH